MTEEQRQELNKKFLGIAAWGEILDSELQDLRRIAEGQQKAIEALKTELVALKEQANQSPYSRNMAEYPPEKPPQEPVTI